MVKDSKTGCCGGVVGSKRVEWGLASANTLLFVLLNHDWTSVGFQGSPTAAPSSAGNTLCKFTLSGSPS